MKRNSQNILDSKVILYATSYEVHVLNYKQCI